MGGGGRRGKGRTAGSGGLGSGSAGSGFWRYPEYRDSGVEWLGEIPAHWEVKRLIETVRSCQTGVWGEDPNGENDVVCVRVADFDRASLTVDLREPTLRSIDPLVMDRHLLQPGDLLLEKSGGGDLQPVGVVVLFSQKSRAVCSNFIARIVVRDRHHCSSFLTYLHNSLYRAGINRRSIKQSTGIQNLDSKRYLSETVALPRIEEQRAIADFLDRESDRIDGLIAKKERLMELLREKRRFLISRAVTRGIDPEAPMKDTGIEWLGEIPAHWELRRLKTLSEMKSGESITSTSIRVSGPFPVFGGNGLRGYTSGFTHEGEHLLVGRQGALCGNVHVGRGRFWASEHTVVVSPEQPNLVEWFAALLEAMDLNQYSVAAAQPGLAVDRLRDLLIPVPPDPEKRTIADFLSPETARIDALVTKVAAATERLNEYRTALVAAAVTGRIDVRGTGHEMRPGLGRKPPTNTRHICDSV